MKLIKPCFEIITKIDREAILKKAELNGGVFYCTEERTAAQERIRVLHCLWEEEIVKVKIIDDIKTICKIIKLKLIKLKPIKYDSWKKLSGLKKSEIIITGNLNEWEQIFLLCCDSSMDLQIREIMVPLQEEFRKCLPEKF